jgi:hypothetical protein
MLVFSGLFSRWARVSGPRPWPALGEGLPTPTRSRPIGLLAFAALPRSALGEGLLTPTLARAGRGSPDPAPVQTDRSPPLPFSALPETNRPRRTE